MEIDVVVLSGGLGQRIRSVFSGPKGLVPIRGKPVVAHVIDWCLAANPRRIVVAAGYGGCELRDELQVRYQSRVYVHIEEAQLGTAGCIMPLLDELPDPFVVVNGDTLIDGDLRAIWDDHKSGNWAATIGVVQTERHDVGRVRLSGAPPDQVAAFQEKGNQDYPWTSAGVYVLRHQIFPTHLRPPSSLEMDILPALAASGQLRAFPMNRIYDIGTPDRLKEVEHQWWNHLPPESR